MAAYLARLRCRSRAPTALAAGALLPDGGAAVAAATDCTLQLLAASEGGQDGEGALELLCEQPVFASIRALAVVPGGASQQVRRAGLWVQAGRGWEWCTGASTWSGWSASTPADRCLCLSPTPSYGRTCWPF